MRETARVQENQATWGLLIKLAASNRHVTGTGSSSWQNVALLGSPCEIMRAIQEDRENSMDLGIKGKRALVCASSKGLGRGCAEALAEAGVNLILNARGAETLEATAAEIRAAHGVEVATVVADVATPQGQDSVIAAAQGVDIL